MKNKKQIIKISILGLAGILILSALMIGAYGYGKQKGESEQMAKDSKTIQSNNFDKHIKVVENAVEQFKQNKAKHVDAKKEFENRLEKSKGLSDKEKAKAKREIKKLNVLIKRDNDLIQTTNEKKHKLKKLERDIHSDKQIDKEIASLELEKELAHANKGKINNKISRLEFERAINSIVKS